MSISCTNYSIENSFFSLAFEKLRTESRILKKFQKGYSQNTSFPFRRSPKNTISKWRMKRDEAGEKASESIQTEPTLNFPNQDSLENHIQLKEESSSISEEIDSLPSKSDSFFHLSRRGSLILSFSAIASAACAKDFIVDAACAAQEIQNQSQSQSQNQINSNFLPSEKVKASRIYDSSVLGFPLLLKDESKAWKKILNAKVVYLGENENEVDYSKKELEIELLKKIKYFCDNEEKSVSILLPYFPHTLQKRINDYMELKISEEVLSKFINKKISFDSNLISNSNSFMPLLRFCRENKIKILATGVPEEVTQEIKENESLSFNSLKRAINLFPNNNNTSNNNYSDNVKDDDDFTLNEDFNNPTNQNMTSGNEKSSTPPNPILSSFLSSADAIIPYSSAPSIVDSNLSDSDNLLIKSSKTIKESQPSDSSAASSTVAESSASTALSASTAPSTSSASSTSASTALSASTVLSTSSAVASTSSSTSAAEAASSLSSSTALSNRTVDAMQEVEDQVIANSIKIEMSQAGSNSLLIVITDAGRVKFGARGPGIPARVSGRQKKLKFSQVVIFLNPEKQSFRQEGDIPEADFLWFSPENICKENCFNRADVANVIGSSGKRKDFLPLDLQIAIERGIVSPDTLSSFFELDKNPILADLAQRFQGLRERWLADPRFLQRLAIEESISITTTLLAQYQKRRGNFLSEIEYVITDTTRGAVVDFFTVWFPAPTLSFRSVSETKAEILTPLPNLMSWLGSLPDNAFQSANVGEVWGWKERFGSILLGGVKLALVGLVSSIGTLTVSNGLVEVRKRFGSGKQVWEFPNPNGEWKAKEKMNESEKSNANEKSNVIEVLNVKDGQGREGVIGGGEEEEIEKEKVKEEIKRSPILKTGLVYAAFLGTSANLRYQVIAGIIEYWIADQLLASQPLMGSILSFVARTANSYWGTQQWVDIARFTGLQSHKIEKSQPLKNEKTSNYWEKEEKEKEEEENGQKFNGHDAVNNVHHELEEHHTFNHHDDINHSNHHCDEYSPSSPPPSPSPSPSSSPFPSSSPSPFPSSSSSSTSTSTSSSLSMLSSSSSSSSSSSPSTYTLDTKSNKVQSEV